MSLKEKLQDELIAAMRARNEIKSSTIRMILTSIKNEEVSGKEAHELSDAEVITILSREAKMRREAAEAFDQAGAKDRADRERAEGVVIAEYLPKQLSKVEIQSIVSATIAEVGAESLLQKGIVMKNLKEKIVGRADARVVLDLIEQSLAE